MRRHLLALAATFAFVIPAWAALAQQGGMITRSSHQNVRTTLDRFGATVRDAGWVVFTNVDHAAAAQAVDTTLRARTVVLFGNPQAGTPACTASSGSPSRFRGARWASG